MYVKYSHFLLAQQLLELWSLVDPYHPSHQVSMHLSYLWAAHKKTETLCTLLQIPAFFPNYLSEDCPCQAHSSSAWQEIPHNLQKAKVHYCVCICLPLVSVHSQINRAYDFPSIHRFFMWPLSFMFPHQNPVCICLRPYACHILSPPHPLGFLENRKMKLHKNI